MSAWIPQQLNPGSIPSPHHSSHPLPHTAAVHGSHVTHGQRPLHSSPHSSGMLPPPPPPPPPPPHFPPLSLAPSHAHSPSPPPPPHLYQSLPAHMSHESQSHLHSPPSHAQLQHSPQHSLDYLYPGVTTHASPPSILTSPTASPFIDKKLPHALHTASPPPLPLPPPPPPMPPQTIAPSSTQSQTPQAHTHSAQLQAAHQLPTPNLAHPATPHQQQQQQSLPTLPHPPPPPPAPSSIHVTASPSQPSQPQQSLPQPTTPKPPASLTTPTKREPATSSNANIDIAALAVTDPTLYHQLKKQRRKRGPKWTVQQTNDLLDALRAYVVDKGYPSSSEHGKTDEWSLINREARQDGRFTGYQACNRVSNLRKDLNAYLETTHLRFLSDAQQNAQAIVQQHMPHAPLDVQREKEQEIANYIRKHTRLTADWCSILDIDDASDTLPYPYSDDINRQLMAAKNKNPDLYSYHTRFRVVCDAMRANTNAASDRKRARAKRKADEGGQVNAIEGAAVVGDGVADGTCGVISQQPTGEHAVSHLADLGDDHAVDDLLPPLADHDDDHPGNGLAKHIHDEEISGEHMLQPPHHHHPHHHPPHIDDALLTQPQHLLPTALDTTLALTQPHLNPYTAANPRKRPISESLEEPSQQKPPQQHTNSNNHTATTVQHTAQPPAQLSSIMCTAEKKKKLTTHDVLAQLHAALLDVEAARSQRKQRIEEAFGSKAEWYDRLALTEEERGRVDRHVRSLVGVFGVTHEMLVACLDPVSVGTWKKMVERYE